MIKERDCCGTFTESPHRDNCEEQAEIKRHGAENAPWLSLAHTICTDAGIEQGHIKDRLTELREYIENMRRDLERYETADRSDKEPAIELKPCPYCGSTDIYVSADDHGAPRWISCNNCEADGPLSSKITDPVEWWNKRA